MFPQLPQEVILPQFQPRKFVPSNLSVSEINIFCTTTLSIPKLSSFAAEFRLVQTRTASFPSTDDPLHSNLTRFSSQLLFPLPHICVPAPLLKLSVQHCLPFKLTYAFSLSQESILMKSSLTE